MDTFHSGPCLNECVFDSKATYPAFIKGTVLLVQPSFLIWSLKNKWENRMEDIH